MRPTIVTCCLLMSVGMVWAQSGTVGRACEDSTDCGTGNYCAGNKRCACLSTYVEIDNYCWRRINPGESGCVQNRQCSAVWPGAYCSNGECKCANNRPPFQTRDGLVCLNYGFCPTNGNNPKLKVFGETVACNGDDATCEAFGGYAYDCVCNTPDCTSGTPITFCCPSRSFACIQPQDEGSGTARLNRWYYDSLTTECRPLRYRGSSGNANNFETKEHCESYCKTTCKRGLPLYNQPTFPGVKQTVQRCSTTNNNCGSNLFTCTTIDHESMCCPTVRFVCSRLGGIPGEIYDDSIWGRPVNTFDPGFYPNGGTGTPVPRYYYDENTNQCINFQYQGAGGNFNNFLSQTECEQFCSRLVCDAGEPLKDQGGTLNQQCTSNSGCPSTHTCRTEFNVCCPTPQYVCKLPRESGICSDYVERWWFNAGTGNCEQFVFSGCKGNANNFATYEKCQTYCRDVGREPQCMQGKALTDSNSNFIVCGGASATSSCPANYYCAYDGASYGCCPTQAFTWYALLSKRRRRRQTANVAEPCANSLGFSQGTACGPSVTRWYYDSSRRQCQTFQFKGCDGNSNNFGTQQDCKEYCRVDACPDGGEIYKDAGGRERTCTSNRNCPNTHFCTSVTRFIGTGFTTSNYCCPTKNFVCSQPRDVGIRCSSSTIERYYFNTDTKSCERFEYNGCSGNRNNFANQRACQNYCLSSACPAGTVVARGTDNSRVTSCSNPGGVGRNSGGCEEEATCYNSPLLGQNVCCGTSKELRALCPANSPPYVNALTLEALQCQPNVDGSCPGNYFCWYSTTGSRVNQFYCCLNPESTVATGLCPPGLQPIAGPGTQEYRYCSPSAAATDVTLGCGAARHCQYADALERYICCGSDTDAALPNICPPEPKDLVPINLGGNYRSCNPQARANTAQACPERSACLYTGTDNGYICCQVRLSRQLTSQAPLTTTPTPLSTAAPVSEDCSGQIGFLPVQPFGQGCSPFEKTSCTQFRNQGSYVRCLWSSRQSRFICCRSQFRNVALADSKQRT